MRARHYTGHSRALEQQWTAGAIALSGQFTHRLSTIVALLLSDRLR